MHKPSPGPVRVQRGAKRKAQTWRPMAVFMWTVLPALPLCLAQTPGTPASKQEVFFPWTQCASLMWTLGWNQGPRGKEQTVNCIFPQGDLNSTGRLRGNTIRSLGYLSCQKVPRSIQDLRLVTSQESVFLLFYLNTSGGRVWIMQRRSFIQDHVTLEPGCLIFSLRKIYLDTPPTPPLPPHIC